MFEQFTDEQLDILHNALSFYTDRALIDDNERKATENIEDLIFDEQERRYHEGREGKKEDAQKTQLVELAQSTSQLLTRYERESEDARDQIGLEVIYADVFYTHLQTLLATLTQLTKEGN